MDDQLPKGRPKVGSTAYYLHPVCAECGKIMVKGEEKYADTRDIECCPSCYPRVKRLIDIRDRRMADIKKYREINKGF